MTTAREKMDQLNARLLERKSVASQVGAVYKFVLDGEGGGTFIVNLKDDVGVREEDGPAPCTLRMSAQDCVDLLEGRANGQALFFGQRLKVEGDIALALKLQALTDILK
ncbi:MAG TPA: SCP2 sterol-binding domain-containing protein [Polyangiaceae bacterium]|nr:SCP2 sterol-binding domain-containing protein [Polyangiaceae bacterium]